MRQLKIKKKKASNKKKSEKDEVLSLNKKGITDYDIGEALSMNTDSVTAVIKRNGGKSNKGKGYTESKKQYKRRK